ncbi:DUF5107 domain-containing protein [Microlunatus sp. Gsoil 973]|uniref:DUF5107 domain-containing protein n=1 Tax=Microlunatus sp. Gsoil 973 TaxID=2672569 RepID=UPI0012B464E6|nr:DUF5107 domain-containing protein [Microlunatus sp. Gsoil 973]QGN33121.1 DUF5107 domain-containing protein [Microlunatus sp. Gsoil 973]
MRNAAFALPARPARLVGAATAAWAEPIELPTYLPDPPSRYPAYLDRRVYQGSSGRVYPLPFHDRIAEHPVPHRWLGLHLENEYLRVLVLPELGGRIHLVVDKRTEYPIFYANPVIKPALVGLAGPWLAGGVEFNWPQHHRPATFLPTAWSVDHGADDGADDSEVTVWCSDHDPFARMKGMHGIRLMAGSTLLELQVRLYNRSDLPQTFLWWANAAAEVHADYQSFFPGDVHLVADHARRALSTFPTATGSYYGVDYPARRPQETRPGSDRRVPGDRLDWYRNIPVPTSYMCLDSTGDFFGGYDHRADAGFVHWADHQIAVGKKQWTWGDAPFGHVWNANLADDGSAYIELMAGVYTDNQPDFSHLAPGETKAFSQYWYPLAGTGPAAAAGRDAALSILADESSTRLNVEVTRALPDADIVLTAADGATAHHVVDLVPDRPFGLDLTGRPATVELRVGGGILVAWSEPEPDPSRRGQSTGAAVEPPPPAAVDSVEVLFLIGRHLQQYRHATRSPEPYWREALHRDPGHAASHVALAARRYDEGLFAAAEQHLRTAIERLTSYNRNPVEGEAHYRLGLTLLRLGREEEAYTAFAKAGWLRAWAGPAGFQLALLDARAGRNRAALSRVDQALRGEPEHLQAAALRILLLRRLGRVAEADADLRRSRRADPLDVWTWVIDGCPQQAGRFGGLAETQLLIDVAGEFARAGDDGQALAQLEQARSLDAHRPLGQTAGGLTAAYRAAALLHRRGDTDEAGRVRRRAAEGDRGWNFPSRLDDVGALEDAVAADRTDATAAALLGHWLYANGRPAEAIRRWRDSLAGDPSDPVVWRNLAVALVNTEDDGGAALSAYERAIERSPRDGRLWYESDQLRRRVGWSPAERLRLLEDADAPVHSRDDLSVEYAQLLITAGRLGEALSLLSRRRFQPWEGGEGQVLRAWDRANVLLATRALRSGHPGAAREHLDRALVPPTSLGEARHPLANPSQLLLLSGDVAAAAGDAAAAREAWQRAARIVGDFSGMAPQPYSDNTYFSVLAARAVGDHELAVGLVDGLSGHVKRLAETPAKIDYFATSLPNLLLFDEDPQRSRDLVVGLLRAQLGVLTDDVETAAGELESLLTLDPSHEAATDLRRDLDHRKERR